VRENLFSVIPHPPYSPDLAPRDFFLFPRTKSQMKEKSFAGVSSEKENAGGLEQHQHRRVPEMFSAVGKTLVQVYRGKRREL
jgi:hypothetical protein